MTGPTDPDSPCSGDFHPDATAPGTEACGGPGADRSTNGMRNDRDEMIERIVRHEWDQFQRTNNEGGRATCQGNWPVFNQMRTSQFLTWTTTLLGSYLHDLERAEQSGRNLITEKYGRMMASTAPREFHERIEPYLPQLGDARTTRQERVIATQVAWAADFRARYPKLGGAMRVLTTAQDTDEATSLETYLRGELGTYSDHTFALYEQFVDDLGSAGRNLTEETILATVRLGGFADLAEAEAAQ